MCLGKLVTYEKKKCGYLTIQRALKYIPDGLMSFIFKMKQCKGKLILSLKRLLFQV